MLLDFVCLNKFLLLHVFRLIIDILVHLNLWYINNFSQLLTEYLLTSIFCFLINLGMYLFFLLQNFQLLMFCMDDPKYMAIWNCSTLFSCVIISRLNNFVNWYGFKCQIIMKVLLSKYKENTDREFALVNFNSTTKKVIGAKDNLDQSFQEVFNR